MEIAGYEIWYGIKVEDLKRLTGMYVEELIHKAALAINGDVEPNRILGEKEFFALRRGDGFEFSDEWENSALVLYGPKASEIMEAWGFGVELCDFDWDFGAKKFPEDLPQWADVEEAKIVFEKAANLLLDADLAMLVISEARCWITPYLGV